MDTVYLLILLLSIAGSFIQRVSGFGFGIFVMIFLPFLIPSFGESVTLSGLLAGTTSLIIAIRNWKFIRWKTMSVIFIFNVIVSYIAIEFMSGLGNEVLKKALGFVLILIAVYFIFFKGKHKVRGNSKFLQATIGSVSGITGGVFAMPGPPIVLYCISTIKDKREYIATLQTLFCLSNVFYSFFRARVGFFTHDVLVYWGIGLAGLFVGTLLGAKCFEYISKETLKKIVYAMMIVSGIIAII